MLEMICFAVVAVALVAPGLIVSLMDEPAPKAEPVAEPVHALDPRLAADKSA